MKFIEYSVNTGKENMLIDEQILNDCIASQSAEPVFRLYGWSPKAISLGKNQHSDFIDESLLSELGVDCVRRLTGGRALLHDRELTYSYVSPVKIIPNGERVVDSYKFISQILIDVFEKLGVTLTIGGCPKHITHNNYCMSVSTGADLCWNNRKFIGSAQYRKQGYVLQHGSILFDYDESLINRLFDEKTNFASIVTLREIDSMISIEDVISCFKSYILTK